jgi:hypothetical protein
MSFYVVANGRESRVAIDLLSIYPQLGFVSRVIDNIPVAEVSYTRSAGPLTVGESVLRTLFEQNLAGGDIVIVGVDADTDIGDGVRMRVEAGRQRFLPRPNAPGIIDAGILYDTSDCNGGGYIVFGVSGECVPFPTPVLLLHELAHCLFPETAETAVREQRAIPVENQFRAERGLPLRGASGGGCRVDAQSRGLCGSDAGSSSTPSQNTSGFTGRIQCFIASAAKGGPNAPEVRELRRLRDDYLIRTSWGRSFFERFYRHYYSFAPAVAAMTQEDDEFRSYIGWGLVDPLLAYLRLIVALPELEAESADYLDRSGTLRQIIDDAHQWLDRIELPCNFAGMSVQATATELALLFQYRIRSAEDRLRYLTALREGGSIPLVGDKAELRAANLLLMRHGMSFEDRATIVGEAYARVRSIAGCGCD